MNIIRTALFLAVISLVIISQTGCGSETANEPISGENYYLDTICRVSVYKMTDTEGAAKPAQEMQDAANQAIEDAFDLCAELDKTLSRTVAVSDVSRINDAGGEWTEVSEDTLALLKEGVKYAALSEGDFDITIGGVTELWDFHADPDAAKVPDADRIKEAVAHVGFDNIQFDGSKVRLADPETRIDLGGIAKGYIGDRMTEVLEADGVESGIINLGGNVICIGSKTDTDDFAIGVEAPFSDRTEIVGKIRARDMTLVTSGVYERKIEVDGKLYHHILSTKTGYSAETDLDAVTLTAPIGHSADIDALSTICLIKGSQAAKQLIENTKGVEAFFILHDGSTDQTSGMEIEAVK